MSAVYTWPSPPSGSNPSVGTNTQVAPTSSTEIGFIDNSGNLQGVSPSNPLPVNVTIESVTTSENLAQVNGATVNVGTGASSTGTQRVAVSSDSSITANAGTNLNTSALALESGGNLASINTKIPVLGQALAGASVPVVLPAAQITTLTPPTTVTVTQATASALNATVIGTTAAGSGAASGLVTVQGNASGTPVPVSGTVTTTPSGEQNVNLNQVGGSAIAIGQQLSAASLPVVLPASQITSLTPPTTVTVTQTTAANLNATVVGAGTAGTPSGGVVSVQGVSGGTPQPVLISSQTLPSAPIAGQTTSTGTAVALASSTALTQGVIIQALATNVGNVYLGPSSVTTSTGFQLQPGQATSVAVNNLNVVYLIAATSGDGVCYIGS